MHFFRLQNRDEARQWALSKDLSTIREHVTASEMALISGDKELLKETLAANCKVDRNRVLAKDQTTEELENEKLGLQSQHGMPLFNPFRIWRSIADICSPAKGSRAENN
jgi:hypothetical protein